MHRHVTAILGVFSMSLDEVSFLELDRHKSELPQNA